MALRDYLAVLRRRKWLVGQAVLLVTVGSVLFSLDQEKLYQASAKVLLSRQNLANSLTGTQDPTLYVQADRIAQTQADVARVATVADRVLRAVPAGSLTVSQFLSRSSVSTAQNADMLTFHVTNHDPGLARRLVDAYAREYTIYRRQLDTASFQRARQSVHARMRTLERAGRQSSPLYARLVDRDEQLATMEALQTSNAYVVQSATKAVQVQPRTVRNGLLGLAFGIVLGIALAFLWEALDTRVRSAEEIGQRLGGLPLLARLAEPARNLRSKNLLATLAEPGGTGAEAFRMLRTNLEFVRLGRGVDSIMVTSAVEQEGKSTTIANLAVSLARSGLRVALVDLDLRRPWLHRYFAIEGPGLTEVALGRATLEQALVSIAVTGPTSQPVEAVVNGSGNGAMRGLLQVLSAGVIPPDPGEFVGTDVLTDILGRLREKADLLLIDAPPALQVGDALTLSTKVDGVIVVTRMNVVRRHMLSELARLLAQTPAEKLGFVITAAQEEADAGYGYGYADYGYAARPDAAPHKVAS